MIKKMTKIMLFALFMVITLTCTKSLLYAEESTEKPTTEEATTEEATTEKPTTEETTTEEPTVEEPLEEEIKKVLFIGNSFTRSGGVDIGEMLEMISENQGHKLEAEVITNPGFYLKYYTNKYIEKFEYYNEFINKLRDNQYDYIVLQESSFGCIEDTMGMIESLNKIKGYIQYYQADAKILLYLTHPYKDGSVLEINDEEQVLSIEKRLAYIQATHTYAGNESGIKVVPAGVAFYRGYLAFPELSWYKSDNKHPDYVAFFTMACTFYREIYGSQPVFLDAYIEDIYLNSIEQQKIAEVAYNTLELEKTYKVLGVGENYEIKYKFVEDKIENIKWSSFDESIVSVKNGIITANREGTTVVCGYTPSGAQATCIVTVENTDVKKAGILFIGNKHVLEIGEKIKSVPRISALYKKDKFRWIVSGKSVAKVDKDGVVTALSPGRAKITIRNVVNGKSASYYVYVRNTAPIDVQDENVVSGTGVRASMYIKLKWKKSSDATHYIIYRSTKADSGYKKIAVTDKIKYTDKTVKRDKAYYYKITAYNKFRMCESDMSTKVKSVALSSPKLTNISQRKKNLKIQWNKNNSATGYIVYRRVGKTKPYKKIAVIEDKTRVVYTDKNVKVNRVYYYTVRSYKKIGDKIYYSNRIGGTKIKTTKKLKR